MKKSTLLTFVVCVSVSAFFSACSQKEPLDAKIKAASTSEFENWRGDAGGMLTPTQWNDLELALRELKIKTMSEAGSSKADVLDEGMRAKINGKTVREAIVLGLQARRDRLEMERREVQARIEHDQAIKTRPGDTASEAYVSRVVKADTARLESLVSEIRDVDSKLGTVQPAASPDKAMAVSTR
jgi:hypothetical protein